MTPQLKAFCVFMVAAGLVAVFFGWVAFSTRHAQDVDAAMARRLRVRFLYALSAVLLVILALTLPHMPYPVAGERPEQVIFVVGKQFAFGVSDRPISNDAEWEAATYSAPVEVPAGALVEFRVSSFDVNHSFGVYSPSGILIAQVQAMPGYVNRLRVRFDEPGTYNAFCLELCGMDHHRMRGVFHVVSRRQAELESSRDRFKSASSLLSWAGRRSRFVVIVNATQDCLSR
jgi:cytochrome c oxidase subunit II